MNRPQIIAEVQISPWKVIVNDQTLVEEDEGKMTAEDFLYKVYRESKIDYSRFFRMDNLSKLGFLGVEFLRKSIDLSEAGSEAVGLIFQNNHSSLDTDLKHQELIDSLDESPSPAKFVYTLPNIMMGEIAIRNQWFGENLFILSDNFDENEWISLASSMIQSKKAEIVLGGWVDMLRNDFELKIVCVKK